MLKNKLYKFVKMIKDPHDAIMPEGAYYYARNIRFVSSEDQINGGFSYEIGNKLTLQIPKPYINHTLNQIEYVVDTFNQEEGVTSSVTKSLKYNVNNQLPTNNAPRNEIERMYLDVNTNEYNRSDTQFPLGYVHAVNSLILITTDNNGFDCVWEIFGDDELYEIKLLYVRNMELTIKHPVELVYNYENENIEKIYWVDTIHQLRHLNLRQNVISGDYTNLIDNDVILIDAVSMVNLPQPIISDISYGGIHTSGMIQYTYNLYKLNGSQTVTAPTTQLVPLGRGDEGGGSINEIVGTAPTIRFENLDTNYDSIQIIAIKYTSLNVQPEVYILDDRKIPANGILEIYDNGSRLETISLNTFKLINNSINFPKTITSKDNVLFRANLKEKSFKLNIDTRAYQFSTAGTSEVYSNIYTNTSGAITGELRIINGSFTDIPDDPFDSINLDYDALKYRYGTRVRGGDGKYIYFENTVDVNNDGKKKYFKDNEIYRLGIQFYNKFGQTTLPMWICDFKAPQGNIEGKCNNIKVGLKDEFYTWLSTQTLDDYNTPVGYKVLVAERTNSDKTILISGLINPMMISNTQSITGIKHETFDNGKRVRVKDSEYNSLDEILRTKVKSTNPAFRNAWLDPSKTDHEVLYNGGTGNGSFRQEAMLNTMLTRLIDSPLQKASHYRNLNSSLVEGHDTLNWRYLSEFPTSHEKAAIYFNYQDSKMMQVYSPEAIFTGIPILPEECTLEIRYAYRNTENYTWLRLVDVVGGNILIDWKIKNRLSTMVNAELNTNINTPIWYSPQDGGVYDDMVWNSGQNQIARAPNGLIYPVGWSRAGMFSNFLGDRFGTMAAEQFQKVQLFYRRYGYTRLQSIRTNVNIPDRNVVIGLPSLEFDSNIVNVPIQGGIAINTQSLIDYPEARTAVVTSTISNLITTNNAIGEIHFNSGLNGDTVTVNKFDNKPQNISVVTTIPIADITGDQYVINSVSVINGDDNEIDGSFDYSVNVDILNTAGQTIVNTVSSRSGNFSSVVDSVVTSVGPPDHIVKPGGTGTAITSYPIYGKPLFTKRAQTSKDYNGDGYFKFNNSLRNVGSDDLGGKDTDIDKTIRTINAEGSNCVTFVLNPEAENDNKKAIAFETIVENAKFRSNNFRTNLGTVYGEIVRPRKEIYFGGIYGGNSFENKKRTSYLEVGSYRTLGDSNTLIESPGDTFVQDFRFLRISKGSTITLTPNIGEHEEILEYLTETTVDLLNRNDSSFNQWDSDFSYNDSEYHKYNPVYSQQNLISMTRDLEYNFKPVNNFNVSVLGSRFKISNEKVDSWLQPSVNDTIDLDGKYGPINKLANLKDEVIVFQDKGISRLSINPKIQYPTGTGGALQLGTGRLLDDYIYLTTTHGSKQWSVAVTEKGIFFADPNNRSINVVDGDGVKDLFESEGFKKFGLDYINPNNYTMDNPLINRGISVGFDPIRLDVYFTFVSILDSWTLVYNLGQSGFSSFYDYHSPMYIPFKGEMYTFNPNNKNQMYQSFKGTPNKFYNENKATEFEFTLNPEPNTECTFNNIEYKDEASYLNSEVNTTFEAIQAYNEFQDSTETPLIPRINLRKLNRKWRVVIPRDRNKVHRIRNTWSRLKLKSNNLQGHKHRIDDVIVYYNANYKKVQ